MKDVSRLEESNRSFIYLFSYFIAENERNKRRLRISLVHFAVLFVERVCFLT